jgi:hypothetical protein
MGAKAQPKAGGRKAGTPNKIQSAAGLLYVHACDRLVETAYGRFRFLARAEGRNLAVLGDAAPTSHQMRNLMVPRVFVLLPLGGKSASFAARSALSNHLLP